MVNSTYCSLSYNLKFPNGNFFQICVVNVWLYFFKLKPITLYKKKYPFDKKLYIINEGEFSFAYILLTYNSVIIR